MLKTITKSSNKKLGGIAATYRSGNDEVFGTCPNSCALKPISRVGSSQIDQEYLSAVIDAVPEDGEAWTYTHFADEASLELLPVWEPGKTVINVSADSVEEAVTSFLEGFPTVVAVPKERDAKVEVVSTSRGPVKFVRCPAEYREEATCSNCGGKSTPLCARAERNYIVKFTAHGNQSKKVGSDERGGCYGSGGPVAIQWKATMTKNANAGRSDSETLKAWVKTLPRGAKIRHHVVGDLG